MQKGAVVRQPPQMSSQGLRPFKPFRNPTLLLLFAGIIMVVTLWFSSRAKNVVKTSIDLSNQQNTKERFNPNFISRAVSYTHLTLPTTPYV